MSDRTTQGLRDVLFDEIDELRSGQGDAAKSMAIANLAKQIINTAQVELNFMRVLKTHQTGQPATLGNLTLGSVASAESRQSSAPPSARKE